MKATRRAFFPLSIAALALLECAVLWAPRPASAGLFDRLKCYSVVSRSRWLASADPGLIDLQPLHDPPFQAEAGCTVKRARPVKVCVPAEQGPLFDPSGPGLSDVYTCYRIRCAGQTRLPLDTENAFGAGTLSINRTRGGSRTLCVPAA